MSYIQRGSYKGSVRIEKGLLREVRVRNISLELRNFSLVLRNVSSVLRNVSLELIIVCVSAHLAVRVHSAACLVELLRHVPQPLCCTHTPPCYSRFIQAAIGLQGIGCLYATGTITWPSHTITAIHLQRMHSVRGRHAHYYVFAHPPLPCAVSASWTAICTVAEATPRRPAAGKAAPLPVKTITASPI